MEAQSAAGISEFIKNYGDVGLFIAMFLESCIIPIPSELVVAAAGAIGIPLGTIVVIGSLGSTFGGMVGYCLGRYGAMPLILKYGKYVMIRPHHLDKAQKFAAKYGAWSVLIGRLLPIIPFKVFSIAAGIGRISFPLFVICTMIALVPRMFLLALFGSWIARYSKLSFLLICFLIIVYVFWRLAKKRMASREKLEQEKTV